MNINTTLHTKLVLARNTYSCFILIINNLKKLIMNLPNQTKAVERKTYNANAVTTGVNASFSFGSLVPIGIKALQGALGAIG